MGAEERVRTESLKGRCCCQLVEEGDATDKGSYRGTITVVRLLDTVRNVFCKVWKDRVVGVSGKERQSQQSQAGFRKIRSGVDYVCAAGFKVRRRKQTRLPTYCAFLGIRQTHGADWRNGLLNKPPNREINGNIPCTLKKLMERIKSAAMLDGE